MNGYEIIVGGADIVEDDSYRALIGSLVVSSAKADFAIMRLAWLLIDPADRRAAQIILHKATGLRIEHLVLRLLKHRVNDDGLTKKVKELFPRLKRVRDIRNAVVHAASIASLHRSKDPTKMVIGTTLASHPNRDEAQYICVPSRDEMVGAVQEAFLLSSQCDIICDLYLDALTKARIAALQAEEE
jgi:hypothetical protein